MSRQIARRCRVSETSGVSSEDCHGSGPTSAYAQSLNVPARRRAGQAQEVRMTTPFGGLSTGAGRLGAGDADIIRATVTVASYPDYPGAQRAVDFLSDEKFPVEHTAIVGSDLRLVENVLGRLTVGRAALTGAATGAWFGLLIGLLLGIFVSVNWFGVVAAAILIGAVWGAIFGAIAQAMTRGRRDFASRSSLRASQYDVNVETDYAEQARQLLTRLAWRPSNPQGSPMPHPTGDAT
jgi:Heat induced stress protein YflT domain